MDWLAQLAERAGPLAEAARGFVRHHLGGRLEPGPAGIAALATRIDADVFADDGPALDEAYVAGAGAVLALLLLQRHGGRGHAARGTRHRVRLGAHGWFDPFRAIEAAIDAEEPLRELAQRVAIAEAEARGDGPVARVRRAFDESVAQHHGGRYDAHDLGGFELDVTLGPDVEVSLRAVFETTSGEPLDAVRRGTDKLASMLPGAGLADGAPPVDRTRLFPRPVSRAFLEELAAAGRGGLLHVGCGLDVPLCIVVTEGGRARYLRTDETGPLDGPEGALHIALTNLEACARHARFTPVEAAPAIMTSRTGDGLDAARLLWTGLPGALGGGAFLASIPHRDALLVCRPEHRATLERVTDDAFRRAPHPITTRIFEIGD